MKKAERVASQSAESHRSISAGPLQAFLLLLQTDFATSPRPEGRTDHRRSSPGFPLENLQSSPTIRPFFILVMGLNHLILTRKRSRLKFQFRGRETGTESFAPAKLGTKVSRPRNI